MDFQTKRPALQRRARAAKRLSLLAEKLDKNPRALLVTPTPEEGIDRSLIENEVLR